MLKKRSYYYKENRRYARIEFGLCISNLKNRKVVGFTRNLSVNGCYLETDEEYPISYQFLANFELPDSLSQIYTLAEVIRKGHDPSGMGILFRLNNGRYFAMLKQFIMDFSF